MNDVNMFDDLLTDQSPSEATWDTDETNDLAYLGTPQQVDDVEQDSEEDGDEAPSYEGNALFTFLQNRGVKDPSRIVFNNEDGSTEEINFDDLSSDEKLEILEQVSDPGLSEDEIATINYLRKNNMSMADAMNAYADQRLQAYLSQNQAAVPQKTYSIDDYSDEELFIADIHRRYPEFTEDEILAKLEEAKRNESLFAKETGMLRTLYKAQEDQEEAERFQMEQQRTEDLRNNLVAAASNFNEFYLDYTDDESDSLVIDNTDKTQMLSYILDQDAEGKSQLIRDIEDPDRLIELALLRTKGPEILSSVTKYWKEQLKETRAENKRLQAQLDKINKRNDSAVIIPQEPKNKKDAAHRTAWDNSGIF